MTSHNGKMQFEKSNFDNFEEAFKSSKQNKIVGFDDLSTNIITDAYQSLKDNLFHVFKAKIQQGILPDSLKIDKVTPIFKPDAKENVCNYFPIFVLPVFSKVF